MSTSTFRVVTVAMMVVAAAGGCSTSAEPDNEAVHRVVTSVAHDIDAKQWNQLRSLYANEVETDYTSLFGGTPQVQSGDNLIDGWKSVLANVATQHLLGPITVDVSGPNATASCHVRAMHYGQGAPGGEHWEVLGHYRFELALEGTSWKIRKMTLLTQMQTGNANLLTESAAR